jgi:6-pyruvoyl tetrahydropterin synthase/QueD family protein
MKIKKKYHFYAAHRNKDAGTKCGRIHGHTYHIEVAFQFKEPQSNVCMLFEDIDKLVEPIVKQYDHYLLLHDKDTLCKVLTDANEPYITLPFTTSAENLAKHLFQQIEEVMPNVCKLSLQETQTSIVIYEPWYKNV